MNLNAMLASSGFDPEKVIVFRHCPPGRELRKLLPWLAVESPDIFNAYQQTQGDVRVESTLKRLAGRGHVASFVGMDPARAVFAGLYAIDAAHPITRSELLENAVDRKLRGLGATDWYTEELARERPTIEWFDLRLTDFYAHWKGRLVVEWPPPERSWWRRAHRNEFRVMAVHEESVLVRPMPDWSALTLGWKELNLLPASWRQRLSQWRGIYYIFDASDGKAYVGSASGQDNILGRWLHYARTGDGGNRLLRGRDPESFRFSILQLVAPDLDREEVVRLETSWKARLHTGAPNGLNEN